MRIRSVLGECLLVSLLSVVFVWPLFKTKYLDIWSSIESTFISDGRFLAENWPHPNWQPLWYCGTRFDYVYPPALRYGTAFLAKTLPIIPARAYHLYIALFYCLGIGGVFLLARIGSGSRRAGWLAAACVAIVSPCFLLIGWTRNEAVASNMTPHRLSVLIRYGEGPHMTALALLGFALATAFVGLKRGNPGWLAACALSSALVVSNNFYGATALAMFFPLVAWSLFVTEGDRKVWLRAAAVAGLAWGLTACWLTPSYVRVTLDNLKLVSQPGKPWSLAAAAAFVTAYLWISWKQARGRKEAAYLVFVCGAAGLFTLNVVGNHYLGFRVVGEPGRLIPELDLALILLLVELARRLWVRLPAAGRVALALAVAAAFVPSWRYIKRPWALIWRTSEYKHRVEYRVTEWMSKNQPDTRALATGSVRFWYNAWFDLPQIGGGSEQGLMNMTSVEAQWQITAGNDVAADVMWMQAVGGGALIVHEKQSKEIYHDYSTPERFRGKLPVLYDNGEGDVIYAVPRRFPERARVVDRARLAASRANVKAYAEALENGPDSRVFVERRGTDEMRLRTATSEGHSIVVQVTFDPCWRAFENGHRLEVTKDPFNFIEILAPPGTHDIRLVFELPLENLAGRILTLASLVLVMVLFAAGFRGRPDIIEAWTGKPA